MPRTNQSPVRGGKRRKWTATETETLHQLVSKYGSGKWREIKDDKALGNILTDRTVAHLKVGCWTWSWTDTEPRGHRIPYRYAHAFRTCICAAIRVVALPRASSSRTLPPLLPPPCAAAAAARMQDKWRNIIIARDRMGE